MASEASTPEGAPADLAIEPALGFERIMRFLATAPMRVEGLITRSSNYTFLVYLEEEDLGALAIYKPRAGETPLWDFPAGTLFQREYAAFLISEALGWRLVPPTVLREGEHGLGVVQLYVDARPQEHYFTLRGRFRRTFQRLAAFDYVINNADRKAGHVLLDSHNQVWAIDHGVCFNEVYKLRTVIWEYAGQPLPDDIAAAIEEVLRQLTRRSALREALRGLLNPREMAALRRRARDLLASRIFPQPGAGRPYPWPLI